MPLGENHLGVLLCSDRDETSDLGTPSDPADRTVLCEVGSAKLTKSSGRLGPETVHHQVEGRSTFKTEHQTVQRSQGSAK